MANTYKDIYDQTFYNKQTLSSDLASREVLKILFGYFKPLSVIDVGCGRGSWLSTAKSFGCKRLRGLDGAWVSQKDLLCEDIDFTPIDLGQQLEIKEKFDLCLSIEVAEHLDESRSQSFVNDLCNLSDVVLFSAAIKYQKGEGHINTQWASFWVDLFSTFDFRCYDVIRWRIWKNKNIDWWFRQNILLFLKENSSSINQKSLVKDIKPIVDVVHPENYAFICKKIE